MGNCVIEVHVTGTHHNGHCADVDQIAARFVDELKAEGQNVTAAFLVSGGEYDLLNKSARFPVAGGTAEKSST